jgi:hypothetical protein
MLTRFSLAAMACLMLSAQAAGQPSKAVPQELNAILCKTEDQAITIATSLAAGKTEPIAIDEVNKAARAQVCRHYIGYGVVEVEKTENHKGSLFVLAGFRLVEDGDLVWTADWVAPFDGSSLSRGI